MKNIKNFNGNKYFYFTIPLLFLVDLMVLNLIENLLVQIALCIFIVFLFSNQLYQFLYILFFLICKQCLFYHSVVFSFISFIFLAGIARKVGALLHPSFLNLQYYGTLILYLLVKNLLLDPWLMDTKGLNSYTLIEIFANIIVMFIVLKCTAKGKLDSRL